MGPPLRGDTASTEMVNGGGAVECGERWGEFARQRLDGGRK